MKQSNSRAVAIWLLVGVGMIMIQVLLGGITRLTGSGLSITEWAPIMGTLPPMNEAEWQKAFEQYKQIPQYQFINTHFQLSDFKFIFFWEWFHRLWARLIGLVFIIPFIWFLIKRSFRKEMIRPLLILFLLGGLQGLVGWIMVASGLQNLVYVSHIRLAIHFILALGLLCYTLWFALQLLVPQGQLVVNGKLRRMAFWLLGLLTLQLIYGALMAGLKAATMAASWPTINGYWLPPAMWVSEAQGLSLITDNPIMVHFIHRGLAYLLTLFIAIWVWRAGKEPGSPAFRKGRFWPLALVLVQVLLGIFTVLYSPHPMALLWLGVAHQFTAMMLLLALVWQVYVLRFGRSG